MIRHSLGILRRWSAVIVIAGAFIWSAAVIATRRAPYAGDDVIVLRIGHWQLEPAVKEAFEALADEYRRTVNPRVRIVQDIIPESTYGQWASTQLMGGTAPDIVEIWNGLPRAIWVSYLDRYFTPISTEVVKPNPYNRGNELEGLALRDTYQDGMRAGYVEELQEFYNVPLSQFAIRIFYNRDLLRKLTGLERPPSDYRGFLEVCRKIESQEVAPGKRYTAIAASAKSHFPSWEMLMFDAPTYGAVKFADVNRDGYVGQDELHVAFRSGAVSLDSDCYRAKLEMALDITAHFQHGFEGASRDEAVPLFQQQKAVFMSTGTWDALSLRKQTADRFEVGVLDFPLPDQTDPQYGSTIAGPMADPRMVGINFAVARTSRHQDIAIDFLKFLAAKQANQVFNDTVGWIPAIRNTTIGPVLEGFTPHVQGVYGAMNMELGGASQVKWYQMYSLFRTRQIDRDELARRFAQLVNNEAAKDFEELRRDWQRGETNNEQYFAGVRARALLAEDTQASRDAWVKYRAGVLARQMRLPIDRARLVSILTSKPPTAPYEYSPAALERLRGTLREPEQSPQSNAARTLIHHSSFRIQHSPVGGTP